MPAFWLTTSYLQRLGLCLQFAHDRRQTLRIHTVLAERDEDREHLLVDAAVQQQRDLIEDYSGCGLLSRVSLASSISLA